MVDLPASVFARTDRTLRVWFSAGGSTFTLVSPDRPIAAAPFALQAQEAANAGTLAGYAPGSKSGNVPVSNGSLNADLSADLLDGYHAGNVSGSVPLSNGSLNADLSADLLDGYHAGNVSGNVALSNGTRNTDLNADLLDGYHAGNASGNVPLSNGTRNANLDADLLDGLHAVLVADVLHRAAPPQANTVTSPASSANRAGGSSITIGVDGFPVVAYSVGYDTDLNVLHCGDAACTAGSTVTTVDATGDVGWQPSITIGADGLPIISYRDNTNAALKVLHCGNAACTAGNADAIVDSGNDVGRYSSIAIGADGLPVIAYYDWDEMSLKVLHCEDVTCTSGNTATKVDSLDVGRFSSIALGADGLPVVSYWDGSSNLKVLHCGDATCETGNTTTVIETPSDDGQSTSIAIGADGLPVVSHWADGGDNLMVVHCGNVACTGDNTVTAADTAGDVGSYSSITVGADGLPVVSYMDRTGGIEHLKVLHCGNTACSAGNMSVTVDTEPYTGHSSAITIGADGLPVVSYFDYGHGSLNVLHCANAFCTPYWRRR